jgi:hypothetical protein
VHIITPNFARSISLNTIPYSWTIIEQAARIELMYWWAAEPCLPFLKRRMSKESYAESACVAGTNLDTSCFGSLDELAKNDIKLGNLAGELIFDHGPCFCAIFLSGLENADDGAGLLLARAQLQFYSREKICHMEVMAAGMYYWVLVIVAVDLNFLACVEDILTPKTSCDGNRADRYKTGNPR